MVKIVFKSSAQKETQELLKQIKHHIKERMLPASHDGQLRASTVKEAQRYVGQGQAYSNVLSFLDLIEISSDKS